MLDRPKRLVQLGWLPGAEEWALRSIRYEFTDHYPETREERLQSLQLAIHSAQRVSELFALLREKPSTLRRDWQWTGLCMTELQHAKR